MSKRFGGEYSPVRERSARAEPVVGLNSFANNQPAPALTKFSGQSVRRSGSRLKTLQMILIPLSISGLLKIKNLDLLGAAGTLGGAAMIFLGLWLAREGITAREAYEAREIARPPTPPRLILGALFTALGVGLAAFLGAKLGLALGLGLGLFAGIAQLGAFGIDPLRPKGIESAQSDFEFTRVTETIAQGEVHLRRFFAQLEGVRDREIMASAEAFGGASERLFRAVERDPKDLTAARKYLSIYLKAAADAAQKYAELARSRQEAPMRARFISLIEDLRLGFEEKTQQLAQNDHSALEVDIELLQSRLRQDGFVR